MAETMLDDQESESAESWGGDEGAEYDLGSEDYGGEAWPDYYGGLGEATSAEVRRRREKERRRRSLMVRRNRRIMAAQRRRQAARPSRPTTAAAAIRRTQAAVQEVDLENKVQADALGGQVSSLARRAGGTEYGLAINAVASHLKDELGEFEQDLGEGTLNVLRDVANYLPLAAVRSPRRGYMNPAVMAAAAGALIAGGSFLLRRNRGDQTGSNVTIGDRSPSVPVGGQLRLQATVKGSGQVVWTSDNDTVASVDAQGLVTGKKAGVANIRATVGTDFDSVPCTVVAVGGGGK